MANDRNQDTLLSVVCAPMLYWLAAILFSFITIQFGIPKLIGGPLYDVNREALSWQEPFYVSGGLLLIAIFVLSIKPAQRKSLEAVRVFMVILLSVLLLSLAVFRTGGFTDSPFSGAVALYIGFFIILSRRKAYARTNMLLILITITLLAAPYLVLLRLGYTKLHVLQWIDTPAVLWSRWTISIIILLIAAWVGDKISGQLSQTV